MTHIRDRRNKSSLSTVRDAHFTITFAEREQGRRQSNVS